jgi:hypothetical protein
VVVSSSPARASPSSCRQCIYLAGARNLNERGRSENFHLTYSILAQGHPSYDVHAGLRDDLAMFILKPP